MTRFALSNLAAEELQQLLQAKNYREFACKVMSLRSKKRKFSYAELARRSGFGSRSFPRDVLIGKKRLTLASLDAFTTGLGLKSDWAEFFRLLVAEEHEACRSKDESLRQVRRTLENLRNRLREQNLNRQERDSAFANFNLPRIYAALGSQEKGADPSEIMRRTGLDEKTVRSGLQALHDCGLTINNQDRYFAICNHVALAEFSKDSYFKDFFLNSLKQVKSAATEDFAANDKLFFTSCFSTLVSDLPQLKEELRAVLHRFVDRAERADGEKVVALLCSLN